MAALVAVTPTSTGTLNPGAAVAASDTIDRAIMGSRGCYLEIINGNASPDNVVISDAGLTPSGNGLPSGLLPLDTVANGTSQIYLIRPDQAVPATGLVTITHSVTATVTYKLYPVGF